MMISSTWDLFSWISLQVDMSLHSGHTHGLKMDSKYQISFIEIFKKKIHTHVSRYRYMLTFCHTNINLNVSNKLTDIKITWNVHDIYLHVRFNWVSEWLLFSANSAIFQLYHGENELIFNEMMMSSPLY